MIDACVENSFTPLVACVGFTLVKASGAFVPAVSKTSSDVEVRRI